FAAVTEPVARSLIRPGDESVERHGHVENGCGHGVSFPRLRATQRAQHTSAASTGRSIVLPTRLQVRLEAPGGCRHRRIDASDPLAVLRGAFAGFFSRLPPSALAAGAGGTAGERRACESESIAFARVTLAPRRATRPPTSDASSRRLLAPPGGRRRPSVT